MPHDVIATCPVSQRRARGHPPSLLHCGTTIDGELNVGRFSRLTKDQQVVLMSFLRSRGNLRDMERELGISYPTVRARVEALVRVLGFGPRDAAADTDDDAGADGAVATATAMADAVASGQRGVQSSACPGRR